MIDYVAMDNRLKWNAMDAKVLRGIFNSFDDFVAVARLWVKKRWEFKKGNRVNETRKLPSERLCDNGYMLAYRRKQEKLLGVATMELENTAGTCEVFQDF